MAVGLAHPVQRRAVGAETAARARPVTAGPSRILQLTRTALLTPRPVAGPSRAATTRERMAAAFGLPTDPGRPQIDPDTDSLVGAEEVDADRDIEASMGTDDRLPAAEHETALDPVSVAVPERALEWEPDEAPELVAGAEVAGLVSGDSAWTMRARILRNARVSAGGGAAVDVESPVDVAKPVEPPKPADPAPELEPETAPEADETTAPVRASGMAKRQVAARVTITPPVDHPPARPVIPPGRPDPFSPSIREQAPIEKSAEPDAPATTVEATARGPPTAGMSHTPTIQAKLSVSSPGDPLEFEADEIALRVLRGGAPSAGGESPSAQSPGIAPHGLVQRASKAVRAPPNAGSSHAVPRTVSSAVASPGRGRPLDAAVRARIEPHLGVDLGHVRVHQGGEAAVAAHDLHARAFTSGATIFLAAGSSPTDVALMAHEATHVVQQQAAPATRSTLMRDVSDFLPDVSLNDLIPDWILDGVRSAVRLTPGYLLLTFITGKDPLTDEPVAVSAERLIETLLTYGPFGAAVGAVLQSIDVLGQIFDFVTEGLAANDLTLVRIERDINAAWDEMSVGNGIAGNLAIVQRYVTALLQDVARFVESIVDRVLEIVRSVVAEVAEPLLETPEIAPVWNLAKKVLHYDPLRGVEVQAPTVEIIADFLRLIGQEQRLAQMQERGTLQETADWLDTQLGTFASLITELGTLFNDAWQAIQPQNLPDLFSTLGALAQRAFGFVQRVGQFAATVIVKILELVKHALLDWLSENAHRVPGFHLLTVILGQNPFTGEQVLRTAENLIKGFITLLPGGEATYQQLAESGVITAAAVRIEGEMARLGISLELITGIFLGIWNTLTLDDLLDPIGAFGRILALFGEPLLRLIVFIGVVIEVVVTLILRLMNFPTELLGSVISNTMQAIADIKRDPVGFLLHMLEAIKLGFIGFFDHIGGYLIDGLVSWLFRGLGQIGITRPPDLSLGSILTLILQVLGLSMEHLWKKLGEHIGAEKVAMIRGALDKLSGAWAFIQDVQRDGLSAIWRYAADQLGAIWSTLLGMATEWIMKTVVVSATVKLLSFLDPTGIMAVINSCVAFFNAVMSAIEYLRDMLEVLNRYVSTVAAVAAGNVVPGAQMLERGLASIIPIAIGFLAKQVGLGNVPEKIVEIIGRLREIVDRALDWLIGQALRLGQAALNALGLGKKEEPAAAHDPEKQARIDAGLAHLEVEQAARVVAGKLSRENADAIASKVKGDHPVFTSLVVVDGGGGGRWDFDYKASPGTIKTGAPKDEKTAREAHDEVIGRMSSDNLSVLKGHGAFTAGHGGPVFTTAERDAVDDIGYATGDHSDMSIKEPGTTTLRPETKWGKLGKANWIPDHQPFRTIGQGGATVSFRFYPHSNTSRYKQGGAVRVYKDWMKKARSRGESNWSQGVESDWFW